MRSLWRGPGGVAFRRSLLVAAGPTAAATLVALVAHGATRPALAGDGDGAAVAAATPWLTLPLFVAAVACTLAAAHVWPTFALRRPGGDAVRRVARGPLGGRGLVVLGAVLAQLALTAPAAVAVAWWLDAPAAARRVHEFAGPDEPVLDRTGATLTFTLPAAAPIDELWLRPRAALPTGPDATEVALTGDGAPLPGSPVSFVETMQLARVEAARPSLRALDLTRASGHVPLLFADGSVVGLGPPDLPNWVNALLLAALAAGTSLAVLAAGAALGRAAGWPTLAAAIASAQFVLWIGGLGPLDDALQAVLRGHWLL